jgi:hypothetical protein
MKRTALVVVGGVLVLAGVTFGLQGLGVIGGSAMSGKTVWALIGPILAVVGLVVLARATRSDRGWARASRRPDDPEDSSGSDRPAP